MSENVRFTPRQLKFIDWLAETKYDRFPPTHEAFAQEIGIASRTLRRWKKLPGFKEAVKRRTRELLDEDFPDILGALRREAKKGNFQHIKMALEMLGEYVPIERREVSGSIGLQLDGLEETLARVYGDDEGDEGT